LPISVSKLSFSFNPLIGPHLLDFEYLKKKGDFDITSNKIGLDGRALGLSRTRWGELATRRP
jgi:hypothetical protein